MECVCKDAPKWARDKCEVQVLILNLFHTGLWFGESRRKVWISQIFMQNLNKQ